MRSFMLIALLATATAIEYSQSQLTDEITDLPGVPAGTKFKMFSGYIDVNAATEPRRAIYYWFVESQSKPESDPLVLWTNGGPGCSGLAGFMTEQGPFRPTVNGTGLTANPNAWNKIANMVFIEQPAGVGFGVNTAKGFKYGDAQAALDNYRFVVGFMKAYPQFKNTDFYTTSESYGGHYMPTLAQEIVKQGGVPNYKGFMVGNPITYMPDRNYGMYGTFYGHQLLPKPLWDSFVNNSCQEINPVAACDAILDEADSLTQGMDPYALDFPVCNDEVARVGRDQRNQLMRKIRSAAGKLERDVLKGYFPSKYEPCNSDYGTIYLNRADVQKAIHIEGTVNWSECSNAVGQAYSNDDVNAPMMDVYKYLIDQKKQPLNLMIFSGDDDSICATMGTQQFIWKLGYAVKEKWAPWMMDGQVSGFTTKFCNLATCTDGLRFSTVHGAGHMVPATRPAQALEVLRKYLSGEW